MLSAVRSAGSRVIEVCLRPIETALLSGVEGPSLPVTFIIGPPRSGTTLVYQVVTTCLKMSYVCNLANRYAYCPAVATYLARPLIRRYRSDFKSHYGRTNSVAGPNERNHFWEKWFGDEPIDETHITPEIRRQVRATIGAIEAIIDAPFIHKTVFHSVRMRALDCVFPGCLFLRIKRDPLLVAQSILQSWPQTPNRYPHRGPIEQTWLSVKPREYERLKDMPLLDQVCGQVFYVERNIDECLTHVGSNRCLEISYESFCAEPANGLGEVRAFFSRHGIEASLRRPPPKSFPASRERKIAPKDYEALRERIAVLYDQQPMGQR